MTINLMSGEQYPPRPKDYSTKCAPVQPGGDCPLWLSFLERVTGDDDELKSYLQRVAGYCLTGHTSEHALFFLHGNGANGKTVFTNTLAGIMGDYAITAPMEIFVESRFERHPTELAMLRGARLVIATETEEGRGWNESRIKAMTGGEKIQARFMRGNFFEYQPTFKIMIVGNHKPQIRNVDEAIRRRLHLIPFDITIPEAERDLNLSENLKDEWPGILAWAVQGCIYWRGIGLKPPEAVKAATDEYLAAEDSFAIWLDEETTPANDAAFELTQDLFAKWKAWAERSGEAVGSVKRFSENMKSRGFSKKKQGGTGRHGFSRIVLQRPNYSDREGY